MEGDSDEAGVIHAAPRPLLPPLPPSRGQEAGPKVSCLRCRDQKLKCDRGLPNCLRCRRQRASCTYPPPPDRRRNTRRKTKPTSSAASTPLSSGVDRATTLGSYQDTMSMEKPSPEDSAGCLGCACVSSPAPSSNQTPSTDAVDTADLPSTEIGLLLLEVYFKRVYNAALLFHKPTMFETYRRNELPGYLLRAIFAHAAVFLQPVSPAYEQHVKIIPIPVLFDNSWAWARSASREVLSYADEPTLPRVQALQVLQLFYFSRGDIQRADIHLSLAHRLCRILGFDRLHDGMSLDPPSRSQQFEHERKRRCFWSVWCSVRIANHQVELPPVLEKVPSLPLPANFTTSDPWRESRLDPDQAPEGWRSGSRSSSTDSRKKQMPQVPLMETIVTLLDIWSHVQDLRSRFPALSNCQRTRKIDKLFELLDPIHQALHLPWTDIESQAVSSHESPELLMSVCSVYYAISFLLHIFMAPTLSGCSTEPIDCSSISAKKADMAFHQAVSFARSLRQFITKGFDITRLWPFVGYAAFLAGSVFLKLGSKSKPIKSYDSWLKAPQSSAEEVKIVQTVLDVLSIYWKPLRGLSPRMNSGEPRDLVTTTLPVDPWHLPSGEPLSHGPHAAGKALVGDSPSESFCGFPGVRNIPTNPVHSQAAEYHSVSCPAQQAPPGSGGCAQTAETDGNLGCHLLSVEGTCDFDVEELGSSCGDGNMDWWYSAAMDPMLDFTTVPNG